MHKQRSSVIYNSWKYVSFAEITVEELNICIYVWLQDVKDLLVTVKGYYM